MGNLQYRKVTREVEDTSFTCDIPSIDEYVKNSYYPTIVQHAYGYSISGRGIVLGYYMIMFREIELDDFPPEIADYDSEIKDRKVSAVHMVHIVINNGAHETVGGMPTVAANIDLVSIAKACGYHQAVSVATYEELDRELVAAKERKALTFIEVKCGIGAREDLGRPTTTALENKQNFMEYLKNLG